MRRLGSSARGSGYSAGMMEDFDAMPSEISPSLMMKSSEGRKFSVSEPKVILRSLFPETWLFDLVDIGEMQEMERFLPCADILSVSFGPHHINHHLVAKLLWLSIGKPPSLDFYAWHASTRLHDKFFKCVMHAHFLLLIFQFACVLQTC